MITENEFLKLYNQGYLDKEIAEQLNCSAKEVSKLRNGLNLNINKPYSKYLDSIRKLHSEGKSDREISDILGLAKTTIQRIRANILKLSYNSKAITIDDIIPLYNSGKSDKEIADVLKCGKEYIKQIRLKNNIKRKDSPKPNEYQYDDIEFQVILGSLLGDGSLRRLNPTGGVILIIHHGIKQLEYLKYKHKLLKKNSLKVTIRKVHDDRLINPDYEDCSFTTRSSISLIDIFNNWYTPKKDIYIEDFKKIEPLGLAIWYMDDGYKTKDGGAIIATDSFSLEKLLQIKEILQSKFNLNINIYETSHKMYIPKQEFKKFKKLIKPYIIPCMRYKVSD